ncbi:MAG: LptF/LptG family permease [Vampirovibrionales bacterium]|nr:LptF/LptG family permease [Vampirovibrionales bacterium]
MMASLSKVDRYFAVQWLSAIGFGVLLFVIIWLAPEILMDVTQAVTDGKLSVVQGVMALLYHVPEILLTAIPMAALLGSVFVVQRLCQQNELVAILSSGISARRLIVPAVAVSLVFSVFYALVQEVWQPAAFSAKTLLYVTHDLQGKSSDPFLFLDRTHRGERAPRWFFMAGEIPLTAKEPFAQVVMLTYAPSTQGVGTEIQSIIQAKSARILNASGLWQLQDGVEYHMRSDGGYEASDTFLKKTVHLSPAVNALAQFHRKNPMALNMLDLQAYVGLLKATHQGQDQRFFSVRLLQKWLNPLTPVLFVILGALIGLEPPRSWRATALTVTAGVLFLYGVSVPFSVNLGSLGVLPIWMAAVLPQLLAMALTGLSIGLLRNTQGYLGQGFWGKA